MRKSLTDMQSKLKAMIDKAEQFSESENENTAEKYGVVMEELVAALEGVDNAINTLDNY